MHKKKLVFDTTVLSNFFIADATALLLSRYEGRGIIVWSVYDELCAGMKKESALREVEVLLKDNRFKLITLSKKEQTFYISLIDSLGRGEAPCIAHAQYANCIVASDDKAARKVCDRHKIPYTGTVGILIASCRESQITGDAADSILRKMVRAGFYSPIRRISDVVQGP
ncbi:MAG: hypothetical protein JXA71_10805 [Chitinispirillaceae bacterium]|nr:hypothetical protein [Chitinispirillaceae bacterium]